MIRCFSSILLILLGLEAVLFIDPNVIGGPKSWPILSICIWLSVLVYRQWSNLKVFDRRLFLWGLFSSFAFFKFLSYDTTFKSWGDVYFFCGQQHQYCTCGFKWNFLGWMKAAVVGNFVLSAALAVQNAALHIGLGGLLAAEESVGRDCIASVVWRLIPYWLSNWERRWGAECSSMLYELPHFAIELLIVLPCAQIVSGRLRILISPINGLEFNMLRRRVNEEFAAAQGDRRILNRGLDHHGQADGEEDQESLEEGGHLDGQDLPFQGEAIIPDGMRWVHNGEEAGQWVENDEGQRARPRGLQARILLRGPATHRLWPDFSNATWGLDVEQETFTGRLRRHARMLFFIVLLTTGAAMNALHTSLRLEKSIWNHPYSEAVLALRPHISSLQFLTANDASFSFSPSAPVFDSFSNNTDIDVSTKATGRGKVVLNMSIASYTSLVLNYTDLSLKSMDLNETSNSSAQTAALFLPLKGKSNSMPLVKVSKEDGFQEEQPDENQVQSLNSDGFGDLQFLLESIKLNLSNSNIANQPHRNKLSKVKVGGKKGDEFPMLNESDLKGSSLKLDALINKSISNTGNLWDFYEIPSAPAYKGFGSASQGFIPSLLSKSTGNMNNVSTTNPLQTNSNAKITKNIRRNDTTFSNFVHKSLSNLLTLGRKSFISQDVQAEEKASLSRASLSDADTPDLKENVKTNMPRVFVDGSGRNILFVLDPSSSLKEKINRGASTVRNPEEQGRAEEALRIDSPFNNTRPNDQVLNAQNKTDMKSTKDTLEGIADEYAAAAFLNRPILLLISLSTNKSNAASASIMSAGGYSHVVSLVAKSLERIGSLFAREDVFCWDAATNVRDAYRKHGSEIAKIMDPHVRSLIPIVEGLLALMRLSCERFFSLVALFLSFILFRDPPRLARLFIRVISTMSNVLQRTVLTLFPAVCWLFDAGIPFSAFVSLLFWGKHISTALSAIPFGFSYRIKGLRLATPEEVARMDRHCVICWESLVALDDLKRQADDRRKKKCADSSEEEGEKNSCACDAKVKGKSNIGNMTLNVEQAENDETTGAAIHGGKASSAHAENSSRQDPLSLNSSSTLSPQTPLHRPSFSTVGFTLPCGHAYHALCLSQWMDQLKWASRTCRCPMCQNSIPVSRSPVMPWTTLRANRAKSLRELRKSKHQDTQDEASSKSRAEIDEIKVFEEEVQELLNGTTMLKPLKSDSQAEAWPPQGQEEDDGPLDSGDEEEEGGNEGMGAWDFARLEVGRRNEHGGRDGGRLQGPALRGEGEGIGMLIGNEGHDALDNEGEQEDDDMDEVADGAEVWLLETHQELRDMIGEFP